MNVIRCREDECEWAAADDYAFNQYNYCPFCGTALDR